MAAPVARLVHKADFERLLGRPSCARSAHFAVHHVNSRPWTRPARVAEPGDANLSTEGAPIGTPSVDNVQAPAPAGLWLGSVVPKRHARRSVTRSLLKRQIRAAVDRHARALPPGLWLVRLRAPFDRAAYPSAASDALRAAARAELDRLFAGAAAPR